MSYYSDSTIKTQYLDPRIYVENSRATFELDSNEAAYLPDNISWRQRHFIN